MICSVQRPHELCMSWHGVKNKQTNRCFRTQQFYPLSPLSDAAAQQLSPIQRYITTWNVSMWYDYPDQTTRAPPPTGRFVWISKDQISKTKVRCSSCLDTLCFGTRCLPLLPVCKHDATNMKTHMSWFLFLFYIAVRSWGDKQDMLALFFFLFSITRRRHLL